LDSHNLNLYHPLGLPCNSPHIHYWMSHEHFSILTPPLPTIQEIDSSRWSSNHHRDQYPVCRIVGHFTNQSRLRRSWQNPKIEGTLITIDNWNLFFGSPDISHRGTGTVILGRPCSDYIGNIRITSQLEYARCSYRHPEWATHNLYLPFNDFIRKGVHIVSIIYG
jgi:hypothetical protein